MPRLSSVSAGLLLMTASAAVQGGTAVDHRLVVEVFPAEHRIEARDVIDPRSAGEQDAGGGVHFLLHGGLAPRVVTPGWRLESVDERHLGEFVGLNASTEALATAIEVEGWRLVPDGATGGPVELRYGGVINHPLETSGEEYQRGFSETPGLIEERGVFLSGASFWVPTFGDSLVTFSLEVRGLDPPWDVVSQGRRVRHELNADGSRTTGWEMAHPTEEIYLVAGPWHESSARAGDVEIFAFLREEDASLATRYLDATARYLTLYQDMLPRYPYESFSLVENFWETGYGMPGFTLLGPQIIRFPWILTSSYPHELLHNWWGNSVYVDYERGNWCEGLTAYMADHLFAEQRGESAEYRRATLKKYADFVSSGSDMPLSEFRSRHSAASEAVGYGKSLMLFHMIRRAVGDRAFLESLGGFYRRHRFSRATFADLAAAFEDVVGGDWGSYFSTWTTRAGAPLLVIRDVRVTETDDASFPFVVRVELGQSQPSEPFPVTVPVAITVDGRPEPVVAEVGSCHRRCSLEIRCPGRPLRIDVDPWFDVMRRLDPREVPPALSTLFGSERPLYVLPAAAAPDELAAWRRLAAAWARPGEPRIVLDSDLEALPGGDAWLLGATNAFAPELKARLAGHPVELSDSRIVLAGDELPRAGHSIVLVTAAGDDPGAAVGWVAADPVAAIPGLERKLPHYTRYSYLAFRGSEPENIAKGMWQPLSSPLVRLLAGGGGVALTPPHRPPLAELPEVFDAATLERTVRVLADPAMDGRGLGSAGLDRATDWVEGLFSELGLEPAGDGGYRQSFDWVGGRPERSMRLTNLVGRIPGGDPAMKNRPVVLLAHLDHLGRGWPDVRAGNAGVVHPGADDNASGVAVLLEVARALLDGPRRARPVLVAVVTGEEAGRIGSRRLIERIGASGEPLACLNLDTVGRLGDGALYVLNADSAREWRFLFQGVGYTTGARIQVVSEPLDSSDQMSCIERGVPAVQLFSGPNADYHRPSDLPELIDATGMAVVAEVALEAVAYLADRAEPLTVTIGPVQASSAPEGAVSRRASLGTMPDFSFAGPGVRVEQVLPESAAAAAGIVPGDVVRAVAGEPVADLRGYSELLKRFAPGDRVTITVLRDGREIDVEAVLGER